MTRRTSGWLGALLCAFLALPGLEAQSIGSPIGAHPGDTLHLTYVVAGSPTAIRVVTSSGKILVQSKLTITARPTPPPDTTPAQPPVDTTPAPPPPPVAGAPWLLEDFTEYGGSTATFKADPRHIWSTGEDADFPSNGMIDTVGGASWRISFPARADCSDYSVGRNLNLPARVAELWLEVRVRFTTNFNAGTQGLGCNGAGAYKFLFGRSDVSRFGFNISIYGAEYEVNYAGNEDPAPGGGWSESADGVSVLYDGAWHTVRLHFRAGPQGLAVLWIDGRLIRTQAGASTASTMYGIAVGRNMTGGPKQAQSYWVQHLAVYQTNPGW